MDRVEQFFFHTTAALAGLCAALAACSPDMSLFGPGGPVRGSAGSGGSPTSTDAAPATATSSNASSSSSGISLFWAAGVQQNVPSASLDGWTECWAEPFSGIDTRVVDILAKCAKGRLAIGCRPKGAPTFSLLAMAPRADAIFDTNPPVNPAATHQANSVEWYFNEYGWGFAPTGDEVILGNCDVVDVKGGAPGMDGDLRMCVKFHSSPEWATHPGFRCGKLWEGASPGFWDAYERVALTAD